MFKDYVANSLSSVAPNTCVTRECTPKIILYRFKIKLVLHIQILQFQQTSEDQQVYLLKVLTNNFTFLIIKVLTKSLSFQILADNLAVLYRQNAVVHVRVTPLAL